VIEGVTQKKTDSFCPNVSAERIKYGVPCFCYNKIMLKKVAALHAAIDTLHSVAIFQLG
jgi:hypothetical protein